MPKKEKLPRSIRSLPIKRKKTRSKMKSMEKFHIEFTFLNDSITFSCSKK